MRVQGGGCRRCHVQRLGLDARLGQLPVLLDTALWRLRIMPGF